MYWYVAVTLAHVVRPRYILLCRRSHAMVSEILSDVFFVDCCSYLTHYLDVLCLTTLSRSRPCTHKSVYCISSLETLWNSRERRQSLESCENSLGTTLVGRLSRTVMSTRFIVAPQKQQQQQSANSNNVACTPTDGPYTAFGNACSTACPARTIAFQLDDAHLCSPKISLLLSLSRIRMMFGRDVCELITDNLTFFWCVVVVSRRAASLVLHALFPTVLVSSGLGSCARG